jgi:hypothetical protein
MAVNHQTRFFARTTTALLVGAHKSLVGLALGHHAPLDDDLASAAAALRISAHSL